MLARVEGGLQGACRNVYIRQACDAGTGQLGMCCLLPARACVPIPAPPLCLAKIRLRGVQLALALVQDGRQQPATKRRALQCLVECAAAGVAACGRLECRRLPLAPHFHAQLHEGIILLVTALPRRPPAYLQPAQFAAVWAAIADVLNMLSDARPHAHASGQGAAQSAASAEERTRWTLNGLLPKMCAMLPGARQSHGILACTASCLPGPLPASRSSVVALLVQARVLSRCPAEADACTCLDSFHALPVCAGCAAALESKCGLQLERKTLLCRSWTCIFPTGELRPDDAEQVARVLSAAAAAIRLLPTCQRVWMQQQEAPPGGQGDASAATRLADVCLLWLRGVCRPLQNSPDPKDRPGSEADQAAVADAVRELHVCCARLLQWGPRPSRRRSLRLSTSTGASLYTAVLLCATRCWALVGGTQRTWGFESE